MVGGLTTVGITGADGFLGWHLQARLFGSPDVDVRRATRQTFHARDGLDRFLRGCDVVVHLAGVNRGEPDEVAEGNVSLARALADAKDRTESSFALVYSNSTKAGNDNVYGRSKQEAGRILAKAQGRAGDRFVDVILPHLFGEHGRPFYNSGVTTFAYQIARGEEPEILVDSELELLHAQDAVQAMLDAVAAANVERIRPKGTRIMVSDALAVLKALATPYLSTGELPEMPTQFELRMFNTFRSQLFPDKCPIPLTKHTDSRGHFFETARSHGQGQAAISTTSPGMSRGGHFHFDKVERFAVIRGEAIVRIRRLLFDKVHSYKVTGDDPVAIDIPTLHPHNITNVGDHELITQFWTNDLFDPANPDTVAEAV